MPPRQKMLASKTKSKGKSKVGESSGGNEEGPRFVSPEANKRYDKLVQKKVTSELYFSRHNPNNEPVIDDIWRTIEALGWEKFCGELEEPIHTVVREFYANMPDCDGSHITVRRMQIPWCPLAINRLFGTFIAGRDCAYDDMPQTEEMMDHIHKALTCGGIVVIKTKNSGTIEAKALCLEARVWLRFINARLIPKGNWSEVTQEQLRLLWCILTGQQIQLGRFLHRQMRKQRSTIGFPSLITSLCVAPGFPLDDQDIPTPVPNPINATIGFKGMRVNANQPPFRLYWPLYKAEMEQGKKAHEINVVVEGFRAASSPAATTAREPAGTSARATPSGPSGPTLYLEPPATAHQLRLETLLAENNQLLAANNTLLMENNTLVRKTRRDIRFIHREYEWMVAQTTVRRSTMPQPPWTPEPDDGADD